MRILSLVGVTVGPFWHAGAVHGELSGVYVLMVDLGWCPEGRSLQRERCLGSKGKQELQGQWIPIAVVGHAGKKTMKS